MPLIKMSKMNIHSAKHELYTHERPSEVLSAAFIKTHKWTQIPSNPNTDTCLSKTIHLPRLIYVNTQHQSDECVRACELGMMSSDSLSIQKQTTTWLVTSWQWRENPQHPGLSEGSHSANAIYPNRPTIRTGWSWWCWDSNSWPSDGCPSSPVL